ncbi:hypothetical protein LWC34_30235 [Kibdelosporangium philippinense]|uniref:TrbL/VirB6 plasmid conjugal transfer protein n=2 Tax=Kibdelosporangium philippinense TaxID=211113 RepID=A0ABS8ZJD0_9PSEU|nr:hypothetical protein [Kibdelosporangium philippinense]MCE7007075.1 hypothetical protein [Kibdelosporangium philippinense]
MAKTDTWVGNQFFNVGKTVVAATNSLWYLLLWGDDDGPVFSNIDRGLGSGAKSLYDNAFTPLLSLVLVLAVVWILFKTLKGALAHIATKLLWILCAFWVAASSYLMPGAYTTFLDTILTDGVREIQGAVLTASGHDPVHGMPELLYDNVIKKTWLEGEFGSATSTMAVDQGPRLIDAQAWTKFDSTETVTQADLDRKKAMFEDVANKVRGTDAEGHFTGTTSARLGTGLLGLVRGLCFAYFPFIALLGQLLGMLILRLVILCAPILGLAMIIYHRAAPGIIRGLGKALASCVLLAVGSTGYLWALPAVLDGVRTPLLQMVIMAVITIIALILIRPIRQITGMISGIVQAAGLNYATRPTVAGWAFRAWRRHRRWNKREKRLLRAIGTKNSKTSTSSPRGRRPETAPTQTAPGPGKATLRRPRPEAGAPQRATSIRFPTARAHGPARRAGQIGPRVFFHGPRVFYHGSGTPADGQHDIGHPPRPAASATQVTLGLPPTRTDSLPPTEIDTRHSTVADPPDWQPHSPAPASGMAEELVIPSEHDEHIRRRAEGDEPDSPPRTPPGSTDEHGQPTFQIYHPSQDQILPHPTNANPSPNRPESQDQGDADADPI